MPPRAWSDEDSRVEKELADRFWKYLERNTTNRYVSPQRLDTPGRQGVSGQQPDFLLRGMDCSGVVLELKRLMRFEVGVEKEVEMQVRKAARRALAQGDRPLPTGYGLVSLPDELMNPDRDYTYEPSVDALRRAFEVAQGTSRCGPSGQPAFALLCNSDGKGLLHVNALVPATEDWGEKEFAKLVAKADGQLGAAGYSPSVGMRVLLLVSDMFEPLRTPGWFWFWQWQTGRGERLPPHHITHIYTISVGVREDATSYVSVFGLWPETDLLSPETCALSNEEAVRIHAYANGKLTPVGIRASGAV